MNNVIYNLCTFSLVRTPHGLVCDETDSNKCTNSWDDHEDSGPKCRTTSVSWSTEKFIYIRTFVLTLSIIMIRGSSANAELDYGTSIQALNPKVEPLM